MSNLYIMIGIPGSGKSTASQQILDKEPNTKIVSSDSLREEYFGDENYQYSNKWLIDNGYDIEELSKGKKVDLCNKFIFKELENRAINYLQSGISVIYDATNLNDMRRKNLIDTFSSYCKYIIAVVLATPIEKCLENNSNRDRQVPEQVIRGMANKFVFPSFEEGFDDIIVVGDESNINY